MEIYCDENSALPTYFVRANVQHFVPSDFLWVAFVALFWWARIGIDFLYMKHDDWPQGPLFTVGHICLATLFLTMTALYSGLALLVAERL